MTYRKAPERRQAAKWHRLLDNGFHFALQHPATGKIILAARFRQELSLAHRLQPFLILVSVDEQISEAK